MLVAVHRDLVSFGDDLADEARGAPRLAPEHEERRLPAQIVEHAQELRCGGWVGTVVEGQCDVIRSAPTDDRRREANGQGRHARECGSRVRERDSRGKATTGCAGDERRVL